MDTGRKAGGMVKQDTVYLKLAQITQVYEPTVYLKDIAKVHCKNKVTEARVKSLRITTFPDKERRASYIGSIMELLAGLEETSADIQVDNLGEVDFIISYVPGGKGNRILQWLKTWFVCAISFFGAAFAIMTFNNDASVTEVFANICYLVTGEESSGFTALEISYSVGLSLGILVFFNHFASWKITVDPTPIEVEMRLYEENLNKTLIQNHGREEKGTDVS